RGVDAERVGQLRLARLAAELLTQRRARLLDPADAGAHRARQPVLVAKLVEHRAADARQRVRAEREPARGIEALERLDEADRAGAHQPLQLQPARAPHHDERVMMNEPDVARDQLAAHGHVAAAIARPQLIGRNAGQVFARTHAAASLIEAPASARPIARTASSTARSSIASSAPAVRAARRSAADSGTPPSRRSARFMKRSAARLSRACTASTSAGSSARLTIRPSSRWGDWSRAILSIA